MGGRGAVCQCEASALVVVGWTVDFPGARGGCVGGEGDVLESARDAVAVVVEGYVVGCGGGVLGYECGTSLRSSFSRAAEHREKEEE
jgi:hypothetical protein